MIVCKLYSFLSLYETDSLNANQITFNTENVVFEFSQQIESPQPQQKRESVPAPSHFQLKSLGWVERDRLNVTANNPSSLMPLMDQASIEMQEKKTQKPFSLRKAKKDLAQCVFTFWSVKEEIFFHFKLDIVLYLFWDPRVGEHLDFPHW